ncbi:MAG: ABC transporter permease subunit [Lachnospiraceae bacterium]|jgi:putative aldouronate transport system permease protein|nr:ABC transporter permease subunit [Lachnospiraceae bacterium]MCH4031877.1 ABC transporter permease subunit [Lachnospiraceae bacterium]MCH4070501.1 ABC transporter permease subunit [Lachnospiraceae bacterium]MCH4109168.1 ABC transporter permease subunit [Lachnospiraceae bacterium]MCI1303003.1 ABC transporter permease subunit [Lachnospiraceae bacterium]
MKNKNLWKKVKRFRSIYILLIPVIAYFVVFSYYPLILGIVKSFQKVKLLGNSEFVGIDNYVTVFTGSQYHQAFVNSLIVGGGTFIFQFFWGLIIALVLNEIRNKIARSSFQTVTFIPYLLSWSVVGGLWITILSPTGMINGFLQLFQGSSFTPAAFMAEEKYARFIMIFTGAWKGAGYFAALFMASIVSIDTSLYEAARIDGATRIQQIRYITIPVIVPTMKVVAVLSVMGILRNFDQIFVMMNATISDKVKNLLYLIYEQGILKFNVGEATAAATLVLVATLLITQVVRKLLHYDQIYE